MATKDTSGTKLVNFRLDTDLIEKSKACAKHTGRSLTGMVTVALREFIERECPAKAK